MNSVATLCAVAFCSLGADAFAVTEADMVGSPAMMVSPQRVINIDSNTRYINVKHGETVTLRENGKSVSWYFDGVAPAFKLSRILPDARADGIGDVQIYVEAELIG